MRREQATDRERVTLSLDHAALTASTTFKMYKVPAGKTFYVERAAYINPTGLVEDNTNNFAGAIANGTKVIANLFNTDANLSPDIGASLAADTFIEGDFSPYLIVLDQTFTAATTDIVTAAAHGLLTGDGPIRVASDDTLPAGLAAATDYWVIKIDDDTLYLAASLEDALLGERVDITDTGTGTHTLSDTSSTLRNIGLDTYRWLAAADILSLVLTETAAATLPAGRLVVEGYLY